MSPGFGGTPRGTAAHDAYMGAWDGYGGAAPSPSAYSALKTLAPDALSPRSAVKQQVRPICIHALLYNLFSISVRNFCQAPFFHNVLENCLLVLPMLWPCTAMQQQVHFITHKRNFHTFVQDILSEAYCAWACFHVCDCSCARWMRRPGCARSRISSRRCPRRPARQ